jgi:hypothetical protein
VDLSALSTGAVLDGGAADVGEFRERSRRRRLTKVFILVSLIAIWMWLRILAGHAPYPGAPHLTRGWRR